MNRHVSNAYHEEPAKEVIHSEAVVSLAKLQPGLCIAGSKDKVHVLYSDFFPSLFPSGPFP